MSLLEWLGESRNPGPVGDVESGAPLPTPGSARVLYARAIIGGIILVGGLYLATRSENRIVGFMLLAVYLVLAYFVNVQPDYSNVGWLGGIIDHPFRWSDDMNRGLVFVKIALFPGRFAAMSVRDAIVRARGRRVIVLKRSGE